MHIACSAKFIIAKFSTYGKYGMNYPALFVCLLATSHKNYWSYIWYTFRQGNHR